MSVDLRRMLDTMATSLMTGTAIALERDYQQRSGFLLGMLLAMAAEQADGAVEWLTEENRAVRALLRDGAPLVGEPALRARLVAAANAADESLRVSVLHTANRALRRLLIEVHRDVETQEGPDARRLDARIWEELRAQNARRRLASAPM